jgi:hypothetical protein
MNDEKFFERLAADYTRENGAELLKEAKEISAEPDDFAVARMDAKLHRAMLKEKTVSSRKKFAAWGAIAASLLVAFFAARTAFVQFENENSAPTNNADVAEITAERVLGVRDDGLAISATNDENDWGFSYDTDEIAEEESIDDLHTVRQRQESETQNELNNLPAMLQPLPRESEDTNGIAQEPDAAEVGEADFAGAGDTRNTAVAGGGAPADEETPPLNDAPAPGSPAFPAPAPPALVYPFENLTVPQGWVMGRHRNSSRDGFFFDIDYINESGHGLIIAFITREPYFYLNAGEIQINNHTVYTFIEFDEHPAMNVLFFEYNGFYFTLETFGDAQALITLAEHWLH